MKRFQIKAKDSYKLSVHVFPARQPKAVIQIIHGMEEHQERYEDFAEFLCQNGYTIVTSDMRGHGMDAADLGYFKEKNGHYALISDQVKILKFIRRKYPGLPVFLFAHSMGTIIARVLLQSYSAYYEKAVLSGFPNYQAGAYAGLFLSSLLKMLHGPKYKSALLQQASVGIFNKAVNNPKTEADWICSNPETVNAYLNDPYCGIGFTCSAFHDLYCLMIQMHKPEAYKNVHKTMPLLMLCGKEDPCVGGKKGRNDSYHILSAAGFQKISQITYPEMRHEILNEKKHRLVYQDILTFLNI
ncbi:alpha/beta hydrolase [bacterium D16-51]|nr:alpha/beta hydrolase [bacterium D16-59]RKI60864.1 alpha/beta hydrolase [bacterium D16-51]